MISKTVRITYTWAPRNVNHTAELTTAHTKNAPRVQNMRLRRPAFGEFLVSIEFPSGLIGNPLFRGPLRVEGEVRIGAPAGRVQSAGAKSVTLFLKRTSLLYGWIKYAARAKRVPRLGRNPPRFIDNDVVLF